VLPVRQARGSVRSVTANQLFPSCPHRPDCPICDTGEPSRPKPPTPADRTSFKQVQKFCRRREWDPLRLNADQVVAYFAGMTSLGRAKGTIENHARAITAIYRSENLPDPMDDPNVRRPYQAFLSTAPTKPVTDMMMDRPPGRRPVG